MTDHVAYPCPYCHQKFLESVATVPYIRGFLLAYVTGHKKFIGCCACVRKRVLKEVGMSSLIGWFSISALLYNPFCIFYGLVRSALVRNNKDAVLSALSEVGIPPPQQPVDVVRIGYSLAASMIASDSRVQSEEVQLATEIGTRLFEGFDEQEFQTAIANHKKLPKPAELADVLSEVLSNDAKLLLYDYLLAIASADGELAPEEHKLLDEIAAHLRVTFRSEPVAEAA